MEFHNTNTVCIPRSSRSVATVRIPDGVENIPPHYYSTFDNLEYIRIPHTVQNIGDYAFRRCYSLQSIVIPEGVTTIGVKCFYACSNLKIVYLPNSVREIKQEAFSRCKSLSIVKLPLQLQSITDFCFICCQMLEHVFIPPTVTSIGVCAFAQCTNLKEINFPNNMIKISQNAFNECISLKKMTFPDLITNTALGVQKLGVNAFLGCNSLVEINLSCYPVHTLEESCFEQCQNLETVILSKETRKLMEMCFLVCSSLKYIGYESTLNYTENTDTRFGLDLEHIELISSSAFVECTSLKSVRLHDNNIVQVSCFDLCENLKKISLPSDLPVETRSDGEKQYDFFPSNNITELILPSEAQNFSYSIIFYVMYKVIQRNPNLLKEKFTPEELYPHEVVNNWLAYEYQERKIPDDAWVANVLYFYIRNSPHLFKM